MALNTTAALVAACAALAFAGAAGAQTPKPGSHFIENWDGDGDGRVVLGEIEAQRDNLFASFDSDDDGVLSAEEYDAFDAARNADLADQPERAQTVLRAVVDTMDRQHTDANGDGAVSRQEFIGQSAAWLESVDADGDAAVTTADFEAIMKATAN